ncbi:hypothetical protein [Flammeovirga sp. SJP92]|uniref:hypothetical protein n=1 Tax=Flammeovirga sp. SJP92 TaxID=1775430 RepID=UPI000789547D|nr:hypothetical protein [Flammeovirga sp. SJP92]KXX68949.1 hypothetical protein AVL50_17465 [Flammeovirga sp. SJP92]
MASLQKITSIRFLPVLSLKTNFSGFDTDIPFFDIKPLNSTENLLREIGAIHRPIDNQWQSSIAQGDIQRSLLILEQLDDEYLYFSVSYKSIESYYLADFPLENMEDTLFQGEIVFDKKSAQLQFNQALTTSSKLKSFDQIGAHELPVQYAQLQSIFAIVKLSKKSFVDCLTHLEKTYKPWVVDLAINSRKLKFKYVIQKPVFEKYKLLVPKGEKEYKQIINEGKLEFISSVTTSASPLVLKGRQLQLSVLMEGEWKVIKQALPSPTTGNLNFDPKTKEPQWIMNM